MSEERDKKASESIQVAIKVRPLIKREKDEKLECQWNIEENAIIPLDNDLKNRSNGGFTFDYIFSPEKNNNDVFQTVVKKIVDSAINGFNGTVFAYGQTSSGKTHTMLGTPKELGIIPLAVDRLFEAISETCGREFLLRVSYLEIYNEKVNDLLNSDNKDLKLREDNNGLVQVLNCKEEVSSSPDCILDAMKRGDKNRRIGETDMNERSSRSHTIFRITIESRDQSSDSDGAIQVSQLNLVDLAGSERARQTNATGERFKEGTHINLSLSNLGLVIKQLSESEKYVSFRDSKLTRLLQASLGGNAMTVMICAVTPAAADETYCTLSFASRAKSVKNKPQLNEVMSDAALLKRYKKQLTKLTTELERLKNENRIAEVEEMESKLQEKENILQQKEQINQVLEERVELLKNAIVSGNNFIKTDNAQKLLKEKNRRRTWAAGNSQARLSLFRPLPCIQESQESFLSTDYSDASIIMTSSISSNSTVTEDKKPRKKCHITSRRSIIQTMDLHDQSFDFADFEIELIENAKSRESRFDQGKKDRNEQKVKFQDKVEVHSISCRNSLSPSAIDANNSSESPGTPKSVLRQHIQQLREDYDSLREFTTLERQMLADEKNSFSTENEKLAMKKEIDDLFTKLNQYDLSQKYAFSCITALSKLLPKQLQSWSPSHLNSSTAEHADVMEDLEKLVELLTSLEEDEAKGDGLSEYEKQLTIDYENTLKELDKVTNEKKELVRENDLMKSKLVEQQEKQKKNETLISNISADTEVLMEKLRGRAQEIDRLKERIFELENINQKFNNEEKENLNQIIEPMETNPILDDSQYKEEIARLSALLKKYTCESGNQKIESATYQCLEKEIKKQSERFQRSEQDLLKVIEEKVGECDKFKQIVENLTKQIEDLHASLLTKSTSSTVTDIETVPKLDSSVLEEKIKEFAKAIDQKNSEIKNLKCVSELAVKYRNYLQIMIGNNQIYEEIEMSVKSEAERSKQLILYIEDLKSTISEKSFEIERHIETQKVLNAEISSLKNLAENAQESEKKWAEMVEETKTEMIKCESFKKELESHIASLKQALEQSTRNEESLIKSLSEKSTEIERLKKTENMLNYEIENLKKSVDVPMECDDQIENVHSNMLLEETNHTKESLIKEVEMKTTEIENLNTKLKNLNELLEANSNSEERLNNLYEESKEELEANKEMKEKLQAEVENLKDILEQISKSEKRLKEIVEEKSVEIGTLKEIETNLRNEIENLRKESSKLISESSLAVQNEMQEIRNNNNILAKELENKNMALEAENLKNKDLKNTVASLQQSLNEMTMTKGQLELQLHEKVLETENLKDLEKKLLNELQIIKEQQNTEVKFNLTNSLADQTEMEDLKLEITPSISELDAQNVNKALSSLVAMTDVDQLESSCVLCKERKNQLLGEIEILKQKIEYFEKLVAEKSLTIDKQSTEIENYKEENGQLQAKLCAATDVDSKKELVEDLIENEGSITNEERCQIEKYKEQIKDLEKVVKDLKDELGIISESEQEIGNQLLQMSKYKKRAEQLAADNDKLKQELNQKAMPTIDEEKSNNEVEQELHKEIEKKNEEIEQYKDIVEQLRDDVESLKQSLDVIKKVFSDGGSADQKAMEDLVHQTLEASMLIENKIAKVQGENQCTQTSLIETTKSDEKFVQTQTSEINEYDVSSTNHEEKVKENYTFVSIETQTEKCSFQQQIKALKEELEILRQKQESELDNKNLKCLDEQMDLDSSYSNIQIQSSSPIPNKSRSHLSLSRTPLKSLQDSTNLQRKLQKKLFETEVSKLQPQEEMNLTNASEVSYNSTLCDEVNMTAMEEKVQALFHEVEVLKENRNQFSNHIIERCTELDEIDKDEVFNESLHESKKLLMESSSRKKADKIRMKNLLQQLEVVENDLKSLQSSQSNISAKLDKLFTGKSFIDTLKKDNEELMAKIEEEEHRLKELSKENGSLQAKNEELMNTQIKLEQKITEFQEELEQLRSELSSKEDLKSAEISNLKSENGRLIKVVNDMQISSDNFKEKVIELEKQLRDFEELKKKNEEFHDKVNLISNNLRDKELELEEVSQTLLERTKEYQEKVKLISTMEVQLINNQEINSEEKVSLLKDFENSKIQLDNVTKENIDLKNELAKLKSQINELREKLNLGNEVDSIKSFIFNELQSMNKNLNQISLEELKKIENKPVIEIFQAFENLIMSYEKEIVKKMQKDFEAEKKKLTEEKNQFRDLEKRASAWVRTLEGDHDKLQIDLSNEEKKNKELGEKLKILEDNFKESLHDNQKLLNTIANLEAELKNLQNDLEKNSKLNEKHDFVINTFQEKERSIKNLEIELESRINAEKDKYLTDIRALQIENENLISLNEDLKNSVEGLELNCEHMKNTLDIKINEIESKERKLEETQKALADQEDIQNNLNIQLSEKDNQLKEMNKILKIKVDRNQEYKAKIESIEPQVDSLKSQLTSCKCQIEKLKEELRNMKLENQSQVNVLQDKISEENLKSEGLTKQIAELKNTNSTLSSTLEETRDRCTELERENATLENKLRHSTGKAKLEAELQELADENRTLKNQMEVIYKRITELQDQKSQLHRDVISVNGKYEQIKQELNNKEITINSLRDKMSSNNLQKVRGDLEKVLQEKKTIVLELDAKKLLLAEKEQTISEYRNKIDEFSLNNKTLNDKLRDLEKATNKKNKEINSLKDDLANLRVEYSKLQIHMTDSSFILQDNKGFKALIEAKSSVEKELTRISAELRKVVIENKELQEKNKALDDEMEELVEHIHKQENEIVELQDRIITGTDSNGIEDIKILEEKNEKLRIDVRATEVINKKLEAEIKILQAEKENYLLRIDDLNEKITDLENKLSKSSNSSNSNSPASRKRLSRQRRSDIFNHNRHLKDGCDLSEDDGSVESRSPTPCNNLLRKSIEEDCNKCTELRSTVCELQNEIVANASKIKQLEEQIHIGLAPHVKKCNELQSKLNIYRSMCSELQENYDKIKLSAKESLLVSCSTCAQKRINTKDQGVQVYVSEKIHFKGMSSGIVEEHLKLEKLEKERNLMKELCRDRARRIKELESKIQEFEGSTIIRR